MLNQNAVAAIRVSTAKQGFNGDSPEAQKEQIERFAAARGITIKEFFIFLESASKELQPMQQAINYCKDPKNDVQLFIVKSIDRFTRGGSFSYDSLKQQLEACDVTLVDIYGVISTQKVNTLEHLGVQYKWSVYSPTKKAELLEAERANDEMRDIMSRMIGAEVRYTRMGYWMRKAPYGLESYKIDTPHGKRCVLRPHRDESDIMINMFELRARGTLDDRQIVDEINKLGYRSRSLTIRSSQDRTKIIGNRGNNKLTLKVFWHHIQNPIYAGIICEKWTENKPIKAQFPGLISYELFNAANKGKLVIGEKDGVVFLHKRPTEERYAVPKGTRNAEFSYRKIVMCSECEKPLFGSSTRGKMGKLYPAYHCNKRGHYFRVPRKDFETTIAEFVHRVKYDQAQIDQLLTAVETVWKQRNQSAIDEEKRFEARIIELRAQAKALVDKIKLVSSEIVIKSIEEDIMHTEEEIKKLMEERDIRSAEKPLDFAIVKQYLKYFLLHLEDLLVKQIDPIQKANFFGLLFNGAPTYGEIVSANKNSVEPPKLNELFKLKNDDSGNLVHPVGFEPTTPGSEDQCSNPLSYGCVTYAIITKNTSVVTKGSTMTKMRDGKIISKELLVDSFKKVVQEKIQLDNGEVLDWIYLDKPSSIVVVALTPDKEAVLVNVYRHNLREDVSELPAGDAANEVMIEGARRELLEETGFTSNEVIELGSYYVLPSETNRRVHYFLTLDAHKVQEPKLDDIIEKYWDMSVKIVPFSELLTIEGAAQHGVTGTESLFGIRLANEYLGKRHEKNRSS
ncbi:NUDIX hydrolase [candidate division TM7 genomosp. GTL1]|nr:NUDIX hydrolase [candidate division TM7 genomosp. GTL1]